jgi:hypothetical protein
VPDNKDKDRLGASEAAQMLGLTREQLLRRVERGEIEGHLEFGRWVISRESVLAYKRRMARMVALRKIASEETQ